ncbi:hypothetical protein ACFE04_017933 [Oxalis oulophora]
MGNDHQRGSSSSSSSSSKSKKGKKSNKNNSDKRKQPQRGLGVAQLEKIRLQNGQIQMGYPSLVHAPYPTNFNQDQGESVQVQEAYSSTPSSSFSYSSLTSFPAASPTPYGYRHPSMMMSLGEYDMRTNIGYGDSQPYTPTSWNLGNGNLDSHLGAQPNTTQHFLNLPMEDSRQKMSKKHRSGSMGSSSQNSELSDSKELDLELRL